MLAQTAFAIAVLSCAPIQRELPDIMYVLILATRCTKNGDGPDIVRQLRRFFLHDLFDILRWHSTIAHETQRAKHHAIAEYWHPRVGKRGIATHQSHRDVKELPVV